MSNSVLNRIRVLLVFLFLISLTIKSQDKQYVFKNYTVEDGLPSSEVYKSFQDEKGFMWFCTDRGVSKYNGFTFTNYTKKDGLSDNVIIDYYKETSSKVWLIGNNGSLSILEKDKIIPYQFNDNIKSFHPSLKIRDISIVNDTVYLGSSGYNSMLIDPEGNISCLFQNKSGSYRVYDKRIDLLYSGSISEDLKFMENPTDSFTLELRLDENIIKYKFDPNWTSGSNTSNLIQINEDLYCLNLSERLFFFNNKKYLYQLELPSQTIFLDFKGGFLWLGTISNGGYQLKLIDDKFVIYKHYFKGKSVSSFTFDSNHSMWITTLNNGVYFFINPNITLPYQNTIDRPYKIWAKENILFTMGFNNRLTAIDVNTDSIVYTRDFVIRPLGIMLNDTMRIVGPDIGYIYNTDINELVPNLTNYSGNVHLPYIFNGKCGGKIWTGFNRGIYLSNSDTLSSLFKDKIFSIKHDSDTNLWIASQSGLYYYNYNDKGVLPEKEGVRFNDFYVKGNHIFGATRGQGLYFSDGDTSISFDQKNGFISDQLNYLRSIDKNNGWATSNEGLTKYNINKDNILTSANYSISEGLVSSELLEMAGNQNDLFINSKKGIMRVPKNKLKADYSANLFLNTVKINGKLTDQDVVRVMKQGEYEFTEELLSLEVDLTPLCLNCLVSQEIKVAINGTEQIIKNNKLLLNSLKSGEYHINFWIKNGNKKWVKADFHLKFILPAPIWQKGWFLIIIILIVITFLMLITSIIIRTFKKRQLEKQKLVEYQQSALLLQMKPHFLFNAMNSIQAQVLEEDKYEAHQYISKFGQLMRKNLEYSDTDLISIEKELNIISLYVGLENRRLVNPINLSIEMSKDIDPTKIMIPPFILQPIVENCIWHGLIDNKSNDGCIVINFSKNKESLLISVADNGIGLEASLRNKSEDHISKGTAILKKRLKLLRTNKNVESYYSIMDRKEIGEKGTLLRISIPLFYEKVESDNIG